jgi:hypothetical protein
VKSTRATQPYRQGPRMPGAALNAMLKGRTAGGYNPADAKRAGYLIAAGKKMAGRPSRKSRTQFHSRQRQRWPYRLGLTRGSRGT